MLHRVPHLSLEVITEKGVEIKGDDLSLNLPELGSSIPHPKSRQYCIMAEMGPATISKGEAKPPT